MRAALALFHYAGCFIILWSVYGTDEWNALSVGFPHTDREYTVALMVCVALASKLMGHVWLFSISRAKAR